MPVRAARNRASWSTRSSRGIAARRRRSSIRSARRLRILPRCSRRPCTQMARRGRQGDPVRTDAALHLLRTAAARPLSRRARRAHGARPTRGDGFAEEALASSRLAADGMSVPRYESLRVWVNYHPYTMARLWSQATRAALELADHPRVTLLRFEDLVREPGGRPYGRSALASASTTTRACSTSSRSIRRTSRPPAGRARACAPTRSTCGDAH